MAAFFRFLSKRRSRRTQHRTEIGQALDKKKNVLTCTIMLLDGTDLTVDIPVCFTCIIKLSVFELHVYRCLKNININQHISQNRCFLKREQVFLTAAIQFCLCCGFTFGERRGIIRFTTHQPFFYIYFFITVCSVLRHADRQHNGGLAQPNCLFYWPTKLVASIFVGHLTDLFVYTHAQVAVFV